MVASKPILVISLALVKADQKLLVQAKYFVYSRQMQKMRSLVQGTTYNNTRVGLEGLDGVHYPITRGISICTGHLK